MGLILFSWYGPSLLHLAIWISLAFCSLRLSSYISMASAKFLWSLSTSWLRYSFSQSGIPWKIKLFSRDLFSTEFIWSFKLWTSPFSLNTSLLSLQFSIVKSSILRCCVSMILLLFNILSMAVWIGAKYAVMFAAMVKFNFFSSSSSSGVSTISALFSVLTGGVFYSFQSWCQPAVLDLGMGFLCSFVFCVGGGICYYYYYSLL